MENTNLANPTETTEVSVEVKKEYNKLVGFINKEYAKVESSTLKIAFALHRIYNEEMYKIDEYKNIYDFGDDKFNLARGTVSNFINVIEKFAKRDENGNVLTGSESAIADEFSKFTWSKLCLLVSVPNEMLPEFDSTMTCKEIREKKTELANRIKENESSALIETEETNMNDAMNTPEESGDTEVESDNDAECTVEENEKRFFTPFKTFDSAEQLIEMLCDVNYQKMFLKHVNVFLNSDLSNFKQKLPKGVVPKIEIGFTF